MKKNKTYQFKATIYKTGINFAVDVPAEITSKLVIKKGYIKVIGTINSFPYHKFLVPVKNGPYRLFVNIPTLKGANAAVGDNALFTVEQAQETDDVMYPTHPAVIEQLTGLGLMDGFNNLTESRRKDINRYINNLKSPETLQKNIDKLIAQLKQQNIPVRIP